MYDAIVRFEFFNIKVSSKYKLKDIISIFFE